LWDDVSSAINQEQHDWLISTILQPRQMIQEILAGTATYRISSITSNKRPLRCLTDKKTGLNSVKQDVGFNIDRETWLIRVL